MRSDDALGRDTELVEAFHGALARRDGAAAIACLDERVYFAPGGDETAPSQGDFSGHDGFRAWWELETGRGWELAALEVRGLGEGVVFAEVMSGAPSCEGSLSLLQGWIYTIAAGAIVAVEVFSTPATALRAR